jgi:hypothetical protein
MVGHGELVGAGDSVGYKVTVGYVVNDSFMVGEGEGAGVIIEGMADAFMVGEGEGAGVIVEGMADGATVASLSIFLSLFLSFCALRLASDANPRTLCRLCLFDSP